MFCVSPIMISMALSQESDDHFPVEWQRFATGGLRSSCPPYDHLDDAIRTIDKPIEYKVLASKQVSGNFQ
jgi:hypothetical protein